MTYSIMVFLTRKPSLTFSEFKEYFENKHIPLMRSILGEHFPLQYRRRYVHRIERPGFGGPNNPDRPPLVIRGSPDDFDFDAVGELTFQDEKAFKEFYNVIYETDVATKVAEDEAQFLDTSLLRAVVIGETNVTSKYGGE